MAEYGRLIGGNYYLTEDIEIEKEIIVISGVVNICLNGYEITRTQVRSGVSSPVIDVWENGELNICDCKGGGRLYSPNFGLLLRGTANLYGGQIYADERGVNVSGDHVFNMYGGKIYGYSMGVYVSQGTANLYGGIVSSDMDATLVDTVNGGKINIDGGEICDDLCHSQGFLGIIWKIVAVIYKLFGINPECACGKVHY